MSPYDVPPKEAEMWSRGQIFRTTIIFIEILVLLTAVLLHNMQGSDDSTTSTIAPVPEMVINTDTQPVERTPMTIYVDTAYIVYVVEAGVHTQVAELAICENRYIDVEFDGVLYNYRDSSVMYRPDVVYAVTFLAGSYEVDVNAIHTQVNIHLDTGTTYTVNLFCNGNYAASLNNIGDEGTQDSSLDAVLEEAMKHGYGHEIGYGCANGGH